MPSMSVPGFTSQHHIKKKVGVREMVPWITELAAQPDNP